MSRENLPQGGLPPKSLPATVPAISVQQPWAWAIMEAGKNIENRDWGTSYRGPLVVHAPSRKAKWWNDGVKALKRLGIEPPPAADLDFGAMIGLVDLVDCLPVGDPSLQGNRWAFGPMCLMLENPRLFERPLAAKGAMGLWHVSTEKLLRQVRLRR